MVYLYFIKQSKLRSHTKILSSGSNQKALSNTKLKKRQNNLNYHLWYSIFHYIALVEVNQKLRYLSTSSIWLFSSILLIWQIGCLSFESRSHNYTSLSVRKLRLKIKIEGCSGSSVINCIIFSQEPRKSALKSFKITVDHLPYCVQGLTITDDLEKTEKERMDLFYNNVKQRKDAGMLQQPTTAKELVAEAERLEIKTKAPLVLAELLFSEKILLEVSHRRLGG